MEWFGEKMLPRGLLELIYQVTPDWILPDLKVVALPRKSERGIGGRIYWHECWFMRLYPTTILAYTKHDLGVRSFNYWMDFLHIALHEIGHITHTRYWNAGYDYSYENDDNYKRYIESLANAWRDKTIAKIMIRDSRLGQPKGWIGGLPGIYLIRRGKWGRENDDGTFGKSDLTRMNDIRAYRCKGQLSLTNLIEQFQRKYSCSKLRNLRTLVKKIALELGIARRHIDKAGRKHLFFTYGESIQVGEALLKAMKGNGLLHHKERENVGLS